MRYLPLLLLLLLSRSGRAQDVILRTTGEEIPARVLTIRPERISYVLPAAPTDTLYLNAPEVFMVRYANGTKELIHAATARAAAPIGLTDAQARQQGQADARKYFKAPGAFWGTMGATVGYFPIGGIVTGAVISNSNPKPRNMLVPDQTLLQNPAYVQGYQQQARRQKYGKAAAGFGVGTGAVLTITAILLVGVLSGF